MDVRGPEVGDQPRGLPAREKGVILAAAPPPSLINSPTGSDRQKLRDLLGCGGEGHCRRPSTGAVPGPHHRHKQSPPVVVEFQGECAADGRRSEGGPSCASQGIYLTGVYFRCWLG